jgi:predicted MPP superfamily phosphohydrolase
MGYFVGLLLVFAIDYYAFQGVKTYFLPDITDFHRIGISSTYWLLSAIIPLLFVFGVIEMKRYDHTPYIVVLLGNIWFILLLSKLVFVFVLFGEDIFRFVSATFIKIFGKTSDVLMDQTTFLPSRRKFVSQSALILAAVPFLSLSYGMIRGRYQYKVHKQTLFFNDLPEAFDGFTITQISDIHSGSFDNREGVLKGLEMIKSLNSDLMVFTGDLVNTLATEFDPWVEDFKTLKADYGKFSVLGNHDYGEYTPWPNNESKNQNFEDIKAQHDKIGFKLMLDESTKIQKDGQSLSLIGIENWGVDFGKKGNLKKALKNVQTDDFKILLSHDPSHWEHEVKDHDQLIHLTMSGHTHGMQMGIEIPGIKWSPIQYKYPKWAGIYEENKRYLYINRGFGVLGFRGRVGIWPEITQIELKRAVS